MAEDTSPDVPPTNRQPIFTDADIDRLACAIKAGTTSDRPQISNIIFDALVVLVGFGLLTGSWLILHSWRPAVDASYSGNAPSMLPLRTLALTAEKRANWSVPSAYAEDVTLNGPGVGGTGQLVLPLRATKENCQSIATELSLSCNGTVVTAQAGITSISAIWRSPQLVYLGGPSAGSNGPSLEHSSIVTVGIQRPSALDDQGSGGTAGASAGTDVTVDLKGTALISWCTPFVSGNTTLTLSDGLGYATEKAFQPDPTCAGKLVIAFEPAPLLPQSPGGTHLRLPSSGRAHDPPQTTSDASRRSISMPQRQLLLPEI